MQTMGKGIKRSGHVHMIYYVNPENPSDHFVSQGSWRMYTIYQNSKECLMRGASPSLRSLGVSLLCRPGDTEMGAHLIAMAMLNLRNNQGHMPALNQSQVDQSTANE